MLFLWPAWTSCKKLLVSGKRAGDTCTGQQAFLLTISPITDLKDIMTVTVAVVKSQATMVEGELGYVTVDFMLDSGSAVSLVQCDVLLKMKNVLQVSEIKPLRLVTASGDQLPILQHIKTSVQLGEFNIVHDFVVVKSL